MTDIYEKLARHLDNTPGGFPETDSKVELRILKQLFTPEEAALALLLNMMPEPVGPIAQRAGTSPEQILPVLAEMGRKGLIIHQNRDGQDLFMLLQFVVGIWEYQVNRLTRDLIRDFNEYVPHLIKAQEQHKTQQLRVVPVAASVTAELAVMDHEHLENLIQNQSKILVAPCICRKEHAMVGKGCGKLEEACLIFGSGAYIYESRGIGRTITREEALAIVRRGAKQGLVAQPSNSAKAMNICLCCDCCCQILSNIKKCSSPARLVNTNFRAVVDDEACTGCQACEEICPMDAVEMDTQRLVAQIDQERCIGCGLCVTACEFDAASLKNKPEMERLDPPLTLVDTYMQIAREKGLF